jgi:hypothetical protein
MIETISLSLLALTTAVLGSVSFPLNTGAQVRVRALGM